MQNKIVQKERIPGAKLKEDLVARKLVFRRLTNHEDYFVAVFEHKDTKAILRVRLDKPDKFFLSEELIGAKAKDLVVYHITNFHGVVTLKAKSLEIELNDNSIVKIAGDVV